jgi:ribonuclease Z
MIDVALLGTGGTMPLPERFLNSLMLRCGGALTLVDCGEGTQVSLKMLGWGFRAVGAILITHFHADHVGGLPGMLLMIGNSGRGADEPLTILGPPGLGRVVEGLRVIAPVLPYPVVIRELTGDPADTVAVGGMTLRAAWGEHELPCLAYRFDLPRGRAFEPDRARALGLPPTLWKVLQRGEAVQHAGRTVSPEEVLGPARKGLAVGFVTDSRPTPAVAELMRGADLLACDAMYGDPAEAPRAAENGHMTFAEAAGLARDAGVGTLWLTHFGPALTDPDAWLAQATAVFPRSVIGRDRMTTTLRFAEG